MRWMQYNTVLQRFAQLQYKSASGASQCTVRSKRVVKNETVQIKTTGWVCIIIIIIISSHEDEMNDKYNDKLCTSNEVISEMSEEI